MASTRSADPVEIPVPVWLCKVYGVPNYTIETKEACDLTPGGDWVAMPPGRPPKYMCKIGSVFNPRIPTKKICEEEGGVWTEIGRPQSTRRTPPRKKPATRSKPKARVKKKKPAVRKKPAKAKKRARR